jgi:glyoxylase-like metal-dependent hydrolase (beta-lactamase superfamily II)
MEMQVTEHVHAVNIPFQVRSPAGRTIDRFVYVYLIFGEKICLIDSGVAGSERVIFNYVRKTGRTPEEIAMIVQTHAHPDHIGATQAVKNATGCVVAAHRAEKSWIEDVELQFRERPIPNFHSLVGGSANVDRILEDGDVLDLDSDLRLEVFHTPGHSNGSISLLLYDDRVLFSGDAIPHAGDLPIYEDVLASVNSLKELKGIKGIHVLVSSWDAPCAGAQVYKLMDDGLQYLQRVHEAVINVADKGFSHEAKEFCAHVLAELGLPLMAANPLVCRSFEAHSQVRNNRDLLRE